MSGVFESEVIHLDETLIGAESVLKVAVYQIKEIFRFILVIENFADLVGSGSFGGYSVRFTDDPSKLRRSH